MTNPIKADGCRRVCIQRNTLHEGGGVEKDSKNTNRNKCTKKMNDNKHNNKQKQNKHKKTKMQVQRNGNSKKIANVPRLVCTSTFGMSAAEAASIEFGKVQCCSL